MTIFAIGLTKCSVILFLRGLFTKENKKAWILCTVLMVVLGLWTFGSTIAISVGCTPYRDLEAEILSRCPGDVSDHDLQLTGCN